MQTDMKERWVTALCSGNYAQGLHRLRSEDNHFCCLGVLLDIIDSTKWIKVKNLGFVWDSHYLENLLCRVMSELELAPAEVDKLSDMNDLGNSFDKIADHIEATL